VELAFAVRDTGCGVDNSNAERLFSAFEQADASYTRKHEGIGLGLALARQFVTLMGGSIGVEANPGGGSIFWFRVRVHASEQPTRHLHWSAPEPLAQGPGEGCASDTRALGPEERERLRAELDQLQALGVTNLRFMGSSEGPEGSPWSVQPSLQPRPGEYREEVWDGLDYLLAEMAKRDMKAVVCLNNFWPWSGGMAQYYHWFRPHKPIPYPPPAEGGSWLSYMLYSARFYRCRPARQAYEQHLQQHQSHHQQHL
jgi:hypothetical protein